MSYIRRMLAVGAAAALCQLGFAVTLTDSGTFTKSYTVEVPGNGTAYTIVTAWSVRQNPVVGPNGIPGGSTPVTTAVGKTIVVVPGMNGAALEVTATCTDGANTSTGYVTNLPVALGPYQVIHLGLVYGSGPAGVNTSTTISW